MKPFASNLKQVFLVHGEPPQSQALAAAIREQYRVEVAIPSPGDSFRLNA
jgi:predicted metal-dependent RNase